MTQYTLGSSKFASAIGLNPYQSRQKLWRLLTGREDPEPKNANMQWGVDNEYRAVAAAEAATGVFFVHTGAGQITCRSGVFTSTPDGDCGHTGLEVKCPEKLYKEVPPHYMVQVQGQMMVCGFDTVIFASWRPEGTRVWMIPRSEEFIEAMRLPLEDFMTCLEADIEPPRFTTKKNPKPVMPDVNTQLIYGEIE